MLGSRSSGIAIAIAASLAVPVAPAAASVSAPIGEVPPPPPREESPAEPAEPEPESEPEHGPDPEGEAKGGLAWGYERPTPRWKWIGFGVSAGVAVVGIAGLVGTRVYLNGRNGFRADLLAAAEASTAKQRGDTFDPEVDFNVVPPTLPPDVNLCDYNSHQYDVVNGAFIKGEPLMAPDGSLGARDAEVGRVCSQGENRKKLQTRFAVVMGIGLVSTLVFTTLLFVHKRRPGEVARAWRRRGLTLGLTSARKSGATLRLSGRF